MREKRYCWGSNLKDLTEKFTIFPKVLNKIVRQDCLVSRHVSNCTHKLIITDKFSFTDKNSHVFNYLKSSDVCKDACSDSCSAVLYSASTHYKLEIKEALQILWERPNLNKQM